MDSQITAAIQSLFETRYLKRIQRSGTSLLLGNQVKESIPEHSFYVSLLGIIIQHLNPQLDLAKLLTMCLTHDLEEVRTGDLNQVNRLYQKKGAELAAFADMWSESELGQKLIQIHTERLAFTSPEAIASQDCDTLAELIIEKEYLDIGNKEAEEWMVFTAQRLKTTEGKMLAQAIIETRTSAWWEKIKNKIRENNGIAPVEYST